MTPYAIARTLSVMTSSGMYDYAGEWIYRVGIPAKSGVGGGILAALPARLGLGSYSPRLDKHGNSVRGIKVCEALSSHYDLHMLNRSDDARNSIIADYTSARAPSRRSRRPHEQRILAAHHHDVRIIELVGTLTLLQYRLRLAPARGAAAPAIHHLRPAPRVAVITRAGAPPARRGLSRARGLQRHRDPVRHQAHLAGMADRSREWTEGLTNVRDFRLLDDAHRMGRGPDRLPPWRRDRLPRDDRAVRTAAARGADGGRTRRPRRARHDQELSTPATKIVARRRARDVAVLPQERRGPCHAARRHPARDADRRAWRSAKWRCWKRIAPPTCWPTNPSPRSKCRWPISSAFANSIPRIGERIMRNLAQLLADRLIVANTKVNLLTAT